MTSEHHDSLFADLSKVYDSVPRKALRRVLEKCYPFEDNEGAEVLASGHAGRGED